MREYFIRERVTGEEICSFQYQGPSPLCLAVASHLRLMFKAHLSSNYLTALSSSGTSSDSVQVSSLPPGEKGTKHISSLEMG